MEDGSHEHDLGETSLAEGDTFVFSLTDTYCSIQYLGREEFGFEFNVALYSTENFEEKVSYASYFVQHGKTFQTGEVRGLVIDKKDGDAILKSLEKK